MPVPNLVELADSDLACAAAYMRKPRSGIVGLDIRELAGGAVALVMGPAAFDVYCGAIDDGLKRRRGLVNHGYILRRA